jgi:transcriptional regulator with XRE-family HTH domain
MPMTALTGSRLRERRAALGMRQADLAERAGISPSYLNLIEHNRRNVTAEVLARLAAALGAEPGAFAEGAEAALIEDLRAAAAALPEAETPAPEIDRAEDFAGRFPGWAGLTAGLQRRVSALERAVATLNDRLTLDPNLSGTLHELLSALSGVRAVASILAETDDLSPDWRQRFHQNLYRDSERLALGAEALVAYLDGSETGEDAGTASPQDEVEAWLDARGWHFPEIEEGRLDAALGAVEEIASSAARDLARQHLRQAAADAAALPLEAVTARLAEIGPDPLRLAADFGAPVLAAMRRLAVLPGAEAGLVMCDASGTLLMRKPAAGFSLPRFGAACPIWPLFSALARPGLPVSALVETARPSAGLFRALAFCEARPAFGFDGPDLRTAAMLVFAERSPREGRPALPVGPTCRICPRDGCPARREPSVLGAGG